MLLGVPVGEVVATMGDRPTKARDLVEYLVDNGMSALPWCRRLSKSGIPEIALMRVRWGKESRRAHWVLKADGTEYDPLVPGKPLYLRNDGRILSYVPVYRLVTS